MFLKECVYLMEAGTKVFVCLFEREREGEGRAGEWVRRERIVSRLHAQGGT